MMQIRTIENKFWNAIAYTLLFTDLETASLQFIDPIKTKSQNINTGVEDMFLLTVTENKSELERELALTRL